jgi:beta-1,4-mannosyl-glycoprotein beta-1,4-N-acetylglucosaminyltransferase
MKSIIDSFLFFNEIDLLKVRLEYLANEIDYFVISEADIDFSGKRKELYLQNKIKDLPFSEKIIYQPIHINLYSPKWISKRLRWITRPHKFLWKIQDAQRDSILESIKNNKLHADLVLFGDLDEFPNLDTLQNIKRGEIDIPYAKSLRQRLFYYLPEIATSDENWFGTVCCPFESFLESYPHKLRSKRDQLVHIDQGGYHLSYFMTPENMKRKILAIADVERLINSKNLSIKEIETTIIDSRDLFGRDLKFIKNTEYLPMNLKNLLYKYMPWTSKEN